MDRSYPEVGLNCSGSKSGVLFTLCEHCRRLNCMVTLECARIMYKFFLKMIIIEDRSIMTANALTLERLGHM